MKTSVPMLLVLAALMAPPAVRAQGAGQLTDLSLEELMRIEIARVFGASQRTQPVTEAPSSITIVTADEIARYGYRSLADIFRGVRGLYVSDDRNYSYVGIRGFAKPGDYNTRVLLLVNGHRVNDNVYDQAGIGADFGIDPAMFERVEIVRGPASALYGTSAFFAVVNVITRRGASLNGGSISVEGGSLGTRRLHAAAGRRLPNGLDFALSGTFTQNDGIKRLYFPAFDTPETNGGIAEGLDSERFGQFYGRASFKNVTMTAAYGRREKDVPAASFGTLFNEQRSREHTTDRRTLFDALYERSAGATTLTARASFDRYAYDGVYPFSSTEPGVPLLVNYDTGLGTRWGIDGRLTRTIRGRQTLSIGAEFFDNLHQNQANSYDPPADPTFSIDRSSRQGGLYAQDEIKLRRWMLLNLGLRYDAYQGTARLTPRGALVFTPSTNQSIKYLYGNAFRAPNVYELDYHSIGVRNEHLQPESIDTHEIVWERYTREWLRTSVSTYWYNAKRLISLQTDPTTFDGLSFVNADHARAEGVELEGEVRLKNGVEALGSYVAQRAIDQATAAVLTNSPRHMAKMRASVPLRAKRSIAALEFQYLSGRATPAGTFVDPAAIANLTFTERVNESFEILGAVRNVFDRRYADPASDEHVPDSIPQNGRTLRVGVRWTFQQK